MNLCINTEIYCYYFHLHILIYYVLYLIQRSLARFSIQFLKAAYVIIFFFLLLYFTDIAFPFLYLFLVHYLFLKNKTPRKSLIKLNSIINYLGNVSFGICLTFCLHFHKANTEDIFRL